MKIKYIKRIVFSLSMLLCISSLYAQKEMNWWYFGYNAGLDFNILQNATATGGGVVPNMPKAVTGPLYTWEGCFTLSNANGDFLMASDGMTVYNKGRTTMANGTGLLGHNSSAQSGVLVPSPGKPNQYYILSVDYGGGTRGITYSIVDLSLNGGNGQIISKNNPLLTGLGNTYENIAVIKKTGKEEYWIVHYRAKTFYVWSLTSTGFSTPQTYTFSGLTVCGTTGEHLAGKLSVSPDNTKLLLCLYMCNLITTATFNPDTGIVSDAKNRNGFDWAYGAEFSSSGEYVYIGSLSYNTYK